MSDDGPPMVQAATEDDPAFSVTFSIRMPQPAFQTIESSLYRLLRTGSSDDHVDVWPEEGGRLVFAHAPVVATSAAGAMTEGRRLADEALALCLGGSVLLQVQAHDWNDETSGATTFWVPEDPTFYLSVGSAVARWWSRRRRALTTREFSRRDAIGNPPPALPTVEFAGVASGEVGLAAFPYEFLSDTGVMIRLHDMQFVGVDYQAESAQLTLRFIYDDPDYTPFEARETPIAVFRFADVEVQRWEDLDDPGADPNRVVAMLYVERHRFMQLVTGRTNLEFTTRRMQVSMEPAQ